MHLQFLLCAVLLVTLSAVGHHVPKSEETYSRAGDFILGGLFPVHETGSSGERCSQLREQETLYRMEAMVFAIEEINRRSDILPNITLGFEIRDTCSDISTTQAAALRFIPSDFTRDGTSPINVSSVGDDEQQIVGVIGTEMSSTTMSAVQLLGLNHIPVVSYYATSDDLSDQTLYPYFLRVVPPDKLQVQAMLKVIGYYGWTYINVVHSDDSYGTNALREILSGTSDIGVCVAGSYEVGLFTTDREYDRIVTDMQTRPEARVIILFIHVEHANSFLAAIRRRKLTRYYQIMGSDGWGMSIGEIDLQNRKTAEGSLKTHLFSANVQEFEDYFLSLTPQYWSGNPWFEEHWNSSRNCSVVKYGPSCLPSSGFSTGSAVSLVIDAVYTVALGLNNMHQSLCGTESGICSAMHPVDLVNLYQFMTNVFFFGRSGRINFDRNGDVIGRYIIDNIQLVNDHYELVSVGFWTALNGSVLLMNTSRVVWGPGEDVLVNGVPSSYCSDPCYYGQIYIPRENECCWNCFNCSDDEITVANQTECFECGERSYPDDHQLVCIPVEAVYMQWDDSLAIMLIFFSIAGIVFCTTVFFFYIRNRENVLIKASSRELCTIIMIGIYMSYLLVFVLITKPCTASCFVCRMMLMLSFTFIYAPMLTRVNRIYRIFTTAQKSVQRPRWISPTSQITIALLLIAVQVIVNVVWLVIEPPAAEELVIAPRDVVLVCNISKGEIVTSLTYNLILITLCSLFAFMARKVPNNYNESRFIALCVYTVLVIWIGFISSYFAINDSSLSVVVLSLAMICNGSITLCFMFLSKLYAIYFDKEMLIGSTAYDSGDGAAETTNGKEETSGNAPPSKKIHIFRGSSVRPSEHGTTSKTYTTSACTEQNLTPHIDAFSQENIYTSTSVSNESNTTS